LSWGVKNKGVNIAMEIKSVNLRSQCILCFVICFVLIIGNLFPINSHASTQAIAANCTATVTPEEIAVGGTFVVSAKGDRQDEYGNLNAEEGDTAYVASNVFVVVYPFKSINSSYMSGAFNDLQSISFTYNQMPQKMSVVIYFDKYKFANGAWTIENSFDYRIEIPLIIKGIVRLDPNGGNLSSSESVKYYQNGDNLGSLPVPTRKGFTFKGWYRNKNIENPGEQISANTKIEFPDSPWTYVYYAQWTKKVTVKFNANGGKVKTKKKIKVYGNTYSSLPKATKKNMVFDGWYTKKKGGKAIGKYTFVKNPKTHTLYAHWRLYITKAEYKKIKKGMSYKKVKKIIGGKGKLIESYTIDNETYKEYYWPAKSGSWDSLPGAYVRFINGKVKPFYSSRRGTYFKYTIGIY
jgi:uncharacterized repeat protein (TIGR02543 family)